jgi:hypothetical protein
MKTKRLLRGGPQSGGAAAPAPPTKTQRVVDTALVIAASTALAYAVAYSYESGYCRYFGIPTYLIVPTPSVLVAAVAGIVLATMGLSPLVAMLRLFLSKAGVPNLARTRFEYVLLMVFVGLSLTGFTWGALFVVIFPAVVILGEYVPVLFTKGTIAERFAAIDNAPDPLLEHSPIAKLVRASGDQRAGQFVVVALMSYFGALGLGAFNARNQSEFEVVLSRPDVALVKSYGDFLIGIKFDERTKAATGEVVVFKANDEFKELHVKSKWIGPLSKAPK